MGQSMWSRATLGIENLQKTPADQH